MHTDIQMTGQSLISIYSKYFNNIKKCYYFMRFFADKYNGKLEVSDSFWYNEYIIKSENIIYEEDVL